MTELEMDERAKATYEKLETKRKPWDELTDFEQLIFSLSIEMVDLGSMVGTLQTRVTFLEGAVTGMLSRFEALEKK